MKNKFAENLSKLRKERGYTQNSFADATGMQRNTIACYETGRRECDFDTLLLFAKILNCLADEMLFDDTDQSSKFNKLHTTNAGQYIF